MSFEKEIKQVMTITFIMILFFSTTLNNVNGDPETKLLLVFSVEEERTLMLDSINQTSITVTSKPMSSLYEENLDIYDILIIASSNEISIDDTTEENLVTFLANPKKSSIIFSPYLENFDTNVLDLLGIENVDDVIDNQNKTNWEIQIDTNIGNFLKNEKFEYTGPLTDIQLKNTTKVLAKAISSNSTDDELNYPFPTLINASNTVTITSPLSLIGNNKEDKSGLTIDAILPNFVKEIIKSIVIDTTNNQVEKNKIVPNTNTGTIPTTDTLSTSLLNNSELISSNETIANTSQVTSDTNNFFSIPIPSQQLSNEIFLLIFLLGIIMLFFRKILAFIRWLIEKGMIYGVFLFGAYFNVQDRNLNHGEVLLNQYRSIILDILDNVGEFGAHLREIKSMTKLGSGSLLWHLQVLEDFGMIYKFNINRNTVFVAMEHVDDFDHNLKTLEMQLKSKHSKTILDKLTNLKNDDIIPINDIIDNTDMNKRTAQRILAKMERYEIIEVISSKPKTVKILNSVNIQKLHKSALVRESFKLVSSKSFDLINE